MNKEIKYQACPIPISLYADYKGGAMQRDAAGSTVAAVSINNSTETEEVISLRSAVCDFTKKPNKIQEPRHPFSLMMPDC